jgi:hypothetical protein
MAKPKHPAEVFGHPIHVASEEARHHREEHWCPFVDDVCDERSRLIDRPVGVCSVRYAEQIIAHSPDRFLQDNTVFYDIANHYFQTWNDLPRLP